MINKRYFWCMCVYGCSCLYACHGQKALNNSFYAFRPYSYNAAYAGLYEGLSIALQFAGQNQGVPSSLKTTNLHFSKGIYDYGGIGLRAYVDERGIFKTTRFQIEGAYKATLDPWAPHLIRFGVTGGAEWARLNIEAITRNGYIDLEDPVLYSREGIDLRFGGALVYQWYGLELGISAPFILSLYEQDRIFWDDFSYAASYSFLLNKDTWTIKPMYLGHFISAGLHIFDAIILLDWDERFWWQAGYRNNNAFLGAVGFGIKGFTVGYAAELPFGDYAVIAGLAHTVMLSFVADEKYFSKRRKRKGRGFYPGRKEEEQEEPTNTKQKEPKKKKRRRWR